MEQTIRAQTRLGFRLVERLAREESDESLLVSPPALGGILTVLLAGASGEARDELARILGVEAPPSAPDGTPSEAQDAVVAWARTLEALGDQGDPRRAELDELMVARQPTLEEAGVPMLHVGTSLWLDAPRRAHPALRELLSGRLAADVEGVDLSSPDGRARIEEWIRDWTFGAARRIPGPPPGSVEALALGSFFFLAAWETPFPDEDTAPAPFHRADGSTVERVFLQRSGSWRFRAGDGARVVRLPYREDRYAMYVALPTPGRTVDDLLRGLDPERWEAWLSEMESRTGEVRLPRMDLRAGAELGDALRALGLERALDPERGAFDGLLASGGSLGVTRVLHHAGLEVDESGTGAFAVATVELEAAMFEADEPFTFVADRPFLVVLRDDRSGATLLTAVVRDPVPADAEP